MSNDKRLSGATDKIFYIVWTPFDTFLKPEPYRNERAAKRAARKFAEAKPGLTYYVLKAETKFEAEISSAVESVLIERERTKDGADV